MSAYQVMPSDTATWISSIFLDRAMAKLTLFPPSAAMFSTMFYQLMWAKFSYLIFWLFVCITSLYLGTSIILTIHFSYFSDFRQQEISNKEILRNLSAHTETIMILLAKLHNEFKYHRLTLKNTITFEQRVYMILDTIITYQNTRVYIRTAVYLLFQWFFAGHR